MLTNFFIRASLALLLLACADRASATDLSGSVPAAGSVPATPDYLKEARTLALSLDRRWLVHEHGKLDWAGINAWQRFVIIDALADYTRLSHDRQFLGEIRQAVTNHQGLDGNDDDLWAIIASADVAALAHDPGLLAYAEQSFAHITRLYWDATCNGGLWWDHARTYKNAITNELLIYASTVLYRATGKPAYQDWALKGLAWFDASGMINASGLINDGLDASCRNNGQPTYTYNQGVILGALANLYRTTGEQGYLDQATRLTAASTSVTLAPAGVLREAVATLGKDGQSFKGIYVRHLGYLYAVLPAGAPRAAIATFLQTNAARVWAPLAQRHGAPADSVVNAYWDGAGQLTGAAAQAAGIDLFNAASRTTGTAAR